MDIGLTARAKMVNFRVILFLKFKKHSSEIPLALADGMNGEM